MAFGVLAVSFNNLFNYLPLLWVGSSRKASLNLSCPAPDPDQGRGLGARPMTGLTGAPGLPGLDLDRRLCQVLLDQTSMESWSGKFSAVSPKSWVCLVEPSLSETWCGVGRWGMVATLQSCHLLPGWSPNSLTLHLVVMACQKHSPRGVESPAFPWLLERNSQLWLTCKRLCTGSECEQASLLESSSPPGTEVRDVPGCWS